MAPGSDRLGLGFPEEQRRERLIVDLHDDLAVLDVGVRRAFDGEQGVLFGQGFSLADVI